jgi:hypothetical protein
MSSTLYYPWNLGVFAFVIALLIYLLTRSTKSTKPELKIVRNPPTMNIKYGEPTSSIIHKYTDEEFNRIKLDAKIEYKKALRVYYAVYFTPVVVDLLSLIAVVNLDIGVPLIISTIVCIALSEFVIIQWKIGKPLPKQGS